VEKKRVLIGTDLHSGHRVGLTPPQYDDAPNNDRWYITRRQLWNAYTEIVDRIKPIDIFICNGDAIDGKGARSGGTELITSDMRRQCHIARDAILYTEAEEYRGTYGTPYHVETQGDDWESILFEDMLGGKIGSHEWFDINGTIFDCKHKVGNSSIPHGKGTPLSKERLSNLMWVDIGEQPKANVVLRGHVHYFTFIGEDHWIAISLPALQGQGSKFGARQCSLPVHFGLVWFDCYEDGSYKWDWEIVRIKEQRRDAEKL
jgi:hypothetical protein